MRRFKERALQFLDARFFYLLAMTAHHPRFSVTIHPPPGLFVSSHIQSIIIRSFLFFNRLSLWPSNHSSTLSFNLYKALLLLDNVSVYPFYLFDNLSEIIQKAFLIRFFSSWLSSFWIFKVICLNHFSKRTVVVAVATFPLSWTYTHTLTMK